MEFNRVGNGGFLSPACRNLVRILNDHLNRFQFPAVAPNGPAIIFGAMVNDDLGQHGMDALPHGTPATGTVDFRKMVPVF